MRKGYLTPPVVIILALIITFVALTLFVNSKLFKNVKNEPFPNPSPTPVSTTSKSISDETADWKTYQGNAFGTKFAFQYSSSLTLKFEGPEGGGTVFADSNGSELLTIYYNSKPQSQGLKDFSTKAATNSIYGGGKKLVKQSTIQVANHEAYKNEIQIENEQLKLQTFVMDPKKNNSGYDNLYNIQNSNPNVLSEKEFDQILSTFKFLD